MGATAEGPQYRRILLKLSGEAFKGSRDYGIHRETVDSFAEAIAEIHRAGVDIGVVCGAGNIFRGAKEGQGMDRNTADYMGMLATVLNAMALQEAIERLGVTTRVQSAIEVRQVAEPFILRRALRHIEKERVVIFAGGTGNPHFTTDTAAVLRAIEIRADVILKATNVDGVYDKDPRKHADARLLTEVDYSYALQHELAVMDATALSLSRDKNVPIIVFNLSDTGNIHRVVWGEKIGTVVRRMPDGEGCHS